jgi:hypothetical protein
LKSGASGEMNIVEYQKKDKMSRIKLFESKQIRSEWNESEQKWYFAIIDVIEVLTESGNPRRYWIDLKRKLNKKDFSIIRNYRTVENDFPLWQKISNL